MLVKLPRKSIVQRIFETESGKLIKVTFLVVEFEGQVRAKLLGAKLILGEVFAAKKPIALPIIPAEETANFACESNSFEGFFLNDLSFFFSQPIRAPAFA